MGLPETDARPKVPFHGARGREELDAPRSGKTKNPRLLSYIEQLNARDARFAQAFDVAAFRHRLDDEAKATLAGAIQGLQRVFVADESINSAKLQASALHELRRALERMDEAERKRTIAALMAYIGELQAGGALESVPTGRLARVVSLVGEAAALVSTPANADLRKALSENVDALPPLFADRTADLQGKLPTALQWFELHWRPLIVEGRSGDDIRQHDFKYYSALASALKRSGRKLSDILPKSPTRGRKGNTEEERQAHLRNLNTARVRRHRDKKRAPT